MKKRNSCIMEQQKEEREEREQITSSHYLIFAQHII
jgi:hypothetical protein